MRRSVARRAQRQRLALEKHRAFIRLFRARQNAHQCGLARAVLSDEHIHLPAVRAEGDAIERDIARIALGDVARLQNDLRGGLIRLDSCDTPRGEPRAFHGEPPCAAQSLAIGL